MGQLRGIRRATQCAVVRRDGGATGHHATGKQHGQRYAEGQHKIHGYVINLVARLICWSRGSILIRDPWPDAVTWQPWATTPHGFRALRERGIAVWRPSPPR